MDGRQGETFAPIVAIQRVSRMREPAGQLSSAGRAPKEVQAKPMELAITKKVNNVNVNNNNHRNISESRRDEGSISQSFIQGAHSRNGDKRSKRVEVAVN